MSKLVTKKGFTIIELSIVISFLAILLILITNTITGISSTYRKGLAMKKINSVGRDLIDELNSAISSSIAINPEVICAQYYDKTVSLDSYNRCIEDDAYLFTYQQHVYDEIISYGNDVKNAPGFGMFCTGTHSYLWNTGYVLDEETFLSSNGAKVPGAQLTYKNEKGEISGSYGVFRILRLDDISRSLCANQISTEYPDTDQISITNTTGSKINIDFIASSPDKKPVELITASEIGGLALYDMMVYPPALDTMSGNKLYVGSFILGTLNSGVTINPLGESCVIPPGSSYSSDYCALNKFNFTIRTAGGNL